MTSPNASRRPQRALAIALTLTGLAVAAYAGPGWRQWAGAATLALSGALAAALALAALTAWRGSSRRPALGAALLLAGAALLLLDAAGVSIEGASPGPVPYELLLAAATAVAGCGVVLRRRSARWLALGLAGAGAVSSGLNLSQWMMAGVVDRAGWALSFWTLGSLGVLASLLGRDVAAQDRLAEREQVWSRRDPLVRWMRAATIAAIVATPMLLVYAFMQAGAVASLTRAAPALAGLLAVGALLGARGQLLGGALLALGGLGLAALAICAVLFAPAGTELRVAAYYLVFWTPAALSGIACGVALAASARRFAPRAR
jgi:hypothetical protein